MRKRKSYINVLTTQKYDSLEIKGVSFRKLFSYKPHLILQTITYGPPRQRRLYVSNIFKNKSRPFLFTCDQER